MIRLSDYLETQPMGEILAEKKRQQEETAMKRLYAAAKPSRGNVGWTTMPTTANYELRQSLGVLRARAREMCRNNGYGKNFLSIVRKNVIGAGGIRLQSKVPFSSGELHTSLNDKVEKAFKKWSKKKFCTMSGRLSFTDAQNLFVTQLARDGEVLVQFIRGADNPFGFSVKFWDVSYLDETFNREETPDGHRIIMSVEVDRNDKPVAYWLTPPATDQWLSRRRDRRRVRVPADQMLHAFLCREDEAETRGLTWFHTALVEAKDLQGYKFGVISSARTAAYVWAMIVPPENTAGGEYDGTDDQNQPIRLNLDPLSVQELPPGYSLQQFDPKQPTQNHAEFYKSILYDVAASLETNYTTLTGDLSDVNYSSIRSGKLDEQDLWRCIQQFVVEHFCEPVFDNWVREAVLYGGLEVTAGQMAGVIENAGWQPRGWSWVDPLKEVKAKIDALDNNLSTLTDELASQGIDIEDHFKKIANERKLAEKYGIDLVYGKPEPKPAADSSAGDAARGYTNGAFLDLEN